MACPVSVSRAPCPELTRWRTVWPNCSRESSCCAGASMDDSEDVRRRANELARAKKAKDEEREAVKAAAVVELERLKERVDACLEGVHEIKGRWRTRIPPNYAILELELQEVVLGKDWLTWARSAVVRSGGEGMFLFEHDDKRYNLEGALDRIKDRAAHWVVHWRGMVERCEERNAVAKAKYEQDLNERIAGNRAAGCFLALVVMAGLLWFFLGP
jgi:hypothetical protein